MLQMARLICRFPLVKDEQIYGFGLNFKTVHQRGKILQLHVDHYGGTDNGRTHAPVPFYVSDRGYGVFINSSRYMTVYAGTGVRKDSPEAPEPRDRNTDKKWSSEPYSDAVEILVPASGVEIYIFAGPTPLMLCADIISIAEEVVCHQDGDLVLLREFQLSTPLNRLKRRQNNLPKRDFPLDFIGLEPGWQSKSYPCTFEWDKTRYPDPAAFVKTMKDMGIQVLTCGQIHMSRLNLPYLDKILPFTGSHTVWGGVVPDFTIPEAQKIFTDSA